MNDLLRPLRATRLTEQFVERFEELILSGQLKIGQKLPSERELARQLGVSRPVVHEGLVELAARGLVTIQPRVGTVVNDYRRDGSLALLSSLLSRADRGLDPDLLEGLLELRRVLEVETARLAALHRTDDDMAELERLLAAEATVDPTDHQAVVDLDFALHHRIALASGNPIYAMLLKSCEPAHRNLASAFFTVPGTLVVVADLHTELVEAVRSRDAARSAAVMQRLLRHGRTVLAEALLSSPEPVRPALG